MTKEQAGRLGGQATAKKYGKNHMSKIGKLGAQATFEKYKILPLGTSQYAMINRETNEIIATF